MLRRFLEEVLTAPPSWLIPVLLPFAYLYAGGVALRKGLYRLGILKPARLPRPVISVGNLTVGGGGKTPIVMWLAETLSEKGVKPAIISRGYGRRSKGVRIVDPDSQWNDFGDEPAMMAARLTRIPVVVSTDRFMAGMDLLRDHDVDLFILDDGFQHFALGRDLDIVVVDELNRFGNGRLLPAGALREPLSRLRDADLIIVTKARKVDPVFESYLCRHSAAPVLWADYRPTGLLPVGHHGATAGMDHPAGPMLAFCGIAGPEGFRNTLERAGIEVAELLVFPDHHPYTPADMDSILRTAAFRQAVGLVTTEKDAVRWPPVKTPLPVYYLSVIPEIVMAEEFLNCVLALVREIQVNP